MTAHVKKLPLEVQDLASDEVFTKSKIQVPTSDEDPILEKLDSNNIHAQLELNAMSNAEKDTCILQLKSQMDSYKDQIDQVATFGEQLAIQLLMQQEQLQECLGLYREEMTQKLFQATHHHPKVASLQSQLEAKDATLKYEREKLQYSVRYTYLANAHKLRSES